MHWLLPTMMCTLCLTSGTAWGQTTPARPAYPPNDPLWHCFECKHPEYKEGGFEGLLRAIGRHTQYPPNLRQDGRVFVRFVIDEQGRVGNVAVAQGLQPDADSAAVRAIRQLGAFWPALDAHGQPLAVPFIVPVRFSREASIDKRRRKQRASSFLPDTR